MKIRKSEKQDQYAPEQVKKEIFFPAKYMEGHIIAVLLFCQVTSDFDIVHKILLFTGFESIFIIMDV